MKKAKIVVCIGGLVDKIRGSIDEKKALIVRCIDGLVDELDRSIDR